MSKKSTKIAVWLADLPEGELDRHYLGYFRCFNRQLYYEAHEVLEELWLAQRQSVEEGFYRGLIQLAGAFVHLQKDRPQPAARLLALARNHLSRYPNVHARLDLTRVRGLIEDWLKRLESADATASLLAPHEAPVLEIIA